MVSKGACGSKAGGLYFEDMKVLAAVLLLAASARAQGGKAIEPFRELAEELARSFEEPGTPVAVLDFGEEGLSAGRKGLGRAAAALLAAELARSGKARVVERAALDKVLEEQRLGLSGAVDPRGAARIGRLAGAKLVVVGSLLELKDGVTVTARAVDVESSLSLAGATQTMPKEILAGAAGDSSAPSWLARLSRRSDELKRQEKEFRRRLADALRRLRRDGEWGYVDINELILDPAPLTGRRVAVLGVPQRINVAGQRFYIGDGLGTQSVIEVDISAFSKAQKRRLLAADFPPHAVTLKGIVVPARGTGPGVRTHRILGADIEDLGRKPDNLFKLSEAIPPAR